MDMNKPKYPVYDNGQIHVSISRGNAKVGNIPQFNTLPGDELLTLASGQVLTNIVGTCGGHCSDCKSSCYAIRSAKFHHKSVIRAWAQNTVILRNDPEKIKNEIGEYCKKNIVKFFRFHTSGELESINQLILYCEICTENPDVNFYIYTKRFDLIEEHFVKNHNQLPENFIINLSEWHENIMKYIYSPNENTRRFFSRLNIFAFDDHTKESVFASNLTHCPAVDRYGHETGVTCAQCRRCMTPNHHTAVHEH